MRGKVISIEYCETAEKDHPRTCGEKFVKIYNFIIERRITPAHAGKSTQTAKTYQLVKDHPRTCGEKFNYIFFTFSDVGSPPHMRGKDKKMCGDLDYKRITPAHAGKRQSLLWC